eukprot:CAMPEP_0181101878 /NCGR_PEP_ID=MMETSP1071-20121207/14002_1 /TAXON_ID=35127 /ORGANISM="Thalassiosira sp., Strain NH16" /LENGTH=95 /DNA_ID=CAMNT_0023184785 /DNA_START=27 /DNA_END=314 /DNA_ORIENTATION=-
MAAAGAPTSCCCVIHAGLFLWDPRPLLAPPRGGAAAAAATIDGWASTERGELLGIATGAPCCCVIHAGLLMWRPLPAPEDATAGATPVSAASTVA